MTNSCPITLSPILTLTFPMCYFSRFLLFFLLVIAVIQPASAQSFTAGRAAQDVFSNGPAPAFTYHIDTHDLNAYAAQQSGEFPLELIFSDDFTWSMNLKRHDLRSASYRLITSNGTETNRSYLESPTFKGTLEGEPESIVRITLSGNFIRAFIQDERGEAYYFESNNTAGPVSSTTISVHQHEEDEGEWACGTSHLHEPSDLPERQHISHARTLVAPYETEIAFAVDRLVYEKYTSLDELELELLTILNYTDAYYDVHQITYRLTETYVATDLESQPWDEKGDPGNMLEEFGDWATNGTLGHHDVVTLWTGISFGSTVGIAWVNAIGSRYRQNLVNFAEGRERRNANIHTHELGHNWGSGHVGSSGWIMSASLSNANAEKNWNSSTLNAFPGYLAEAMEHLDDLEDETRLLVGISDIAVGDEDNDSGELDPGETATLSIAVENQSDVPLENVLVSLEADNDLAKNHVTINSESVTIAVIEPGSTEDATFNVSLAAEAPIDERLRFLYQITEDIRTAEFTPTIVSGDQPIDELPVELISFEVVVTETGATLLWETASETNNAGFEIELSYNDAEFETAAFIQGAGTTSNLQRYRYDLDNLRAGLYAFRLKQIDFDGQFEHSDIVSVEIIPNSYSLEQNYPNPFNPQTRIEFQLPATRHVTLEVFDSLGRRVALLVDGLKKAGPNSVTFDAKDLPNGTYIYRIQAGSFQETKSMILLK